MIECDLLDLLFENDADLYRFVFDDLLILYVDM